MGSSSSVRGYFGWYVSNILVTYIHFFSRTIDCGRAGNRNFISRRLTRTNGNKALRFRINCLMAFVFGLFSFVVLLEIHRKGARFTSLQSRRAANYGDGATRRVFLNGAICWFYVNVGGVEYKDARIAKPTRIVRGYPFGKGIAGDVTSNVRIRRSIGAS